MFARLRIAAPVVMVVALAGCGATTPPDPHMHVLPSTTVRPGQTVTFDASQLPGDPPDNTNPETTYKWDLDGNGSFEVIGKNAQRTYSQPGHYQVTLVESNTNGRSWADNWVTQTVIVQAPSSGGPGTPPNQPPSASFTYSPSNPCTECPTSFDASASSDPDGHIVNYQWDWDNNGTWDSSGPGPTATHAFTVTGLTTVRLRVTDDQGSATITSRQFTVSDAPPPGKVLAREWPALAAAGAGTPFSLNLSAIRLTPGTKVLNGLELVTAGVTGHGRLRFTRLPTALEPHRTARWAGILSVIQTGNGAAAQLAGQGYVLFKFSKRDSLCFAGTVAGDYKGAPFTGRLGTAGGTGLGAHVRGTGTFSLPVTSGATTLKGRLNLRKTRSRRALPRACKPLVRLLGG